MRLVFQNANGKERVIANVSDGYEANSEIKKFCANHDFHIPYTRVWKNDDNVTTYDVGSHFEFFKLYPDD